MNHIDDIKMALLKVAANMPISKDKGTVPLILLFERGIIAKQPDMKPVFNDCNIAAVDANAETLSLPAAIQITFDFASESCGGGVFRFKRVRHNGY